MPALRHMAVITAEPEKSSLQDDEPPARWPAAKQTWSVPSMSKLSTTAALQSCPSACRQTPWTGGSFNAYGPMGLDWLPAFTTLASTKCLDNMSPSSSRLCVAVSTNVQSPLTSSNSGIARNTCSIPPQRSNTAGLSRKSCDILAAASSKRAASSGFTKRAA